jgi:hypothetical protein
MAKHRTKHHNPDPNEMGKSKPPQDPKAEKAPDQLPAQPAPTEENIDLGESVAPTGGAGPESGTSAVDWGKLADARATDTGVQPIQVDSPSDADLLAHVAAEQAATAGLPPPQETTAQEKPGAVEPAEEVPTEPAPTASSEEDEEAEVIFDSATMQALAPQPPTDQPAPSSATTASASPAPPPASEPTSAQSTTPELHAATSGAGAAASDVVAETSIGDSAHAAMGEPSTSAVSPSGTSAVELGGALTPAASQSAGPLSPSTPEPSQPPAIDSGIDLMVEEMAHREPSTDRLDVDEVSLSDDVSGRDLIAEAVESGVDLARHGKADESDEAEDLLAEPAPTEFGPSSAVDLGGDAIKPTISPSDLGASEPHLRPQDSEVFEADSADAASGSQVFDPEVIEDDEELEPEVVADEEPDVVGEEAPADAEMSPSGILEPTIVEDVFEGEIPSPESTAPESGLPQISTPEEDFFEGSGLEPIPGSDMGAAGAEHQKRPSADDLRATASAEAALSGAVRSLEPPAEDDEEGAVDYQSEESAVVEMPSSGSRVTPVADEDAIDLEAVGETAMTSPPPFRESSEGDIDLEGLIGSESASKPPSKARGPRRPDSSDVDFEALVDAAESSGATTEADELRPVSSSEETDLSETGQLPEDAVDLGAEPEVVDEEGPHSPVPTRPAPTPARRGGGMLVGALTGIVLGAGACVGLWFMKIEPPKEWRGESGGSTANPSANQAAAKPPEPTFNDKLAMHRSGDLDRAAAAGIEKIDETKADQRAGRGQFRYDRLRSEAAKKKTPLKADDEKVKEAETDLTEAIKLDENNADARLSLIRLEAAVGKLDEAKKTCDEALKQFKDKPEEAYFEAARIELDLRQPKPNGVGRRFENEGELRRALALALIGLLADDEDKPPPEAALAFVKALKSASGAAPDYAAALKALAEARANHDVRRHLFPNRPQNPLSDPEERVFLYACDELKAYWQLKDKLQKNKFKSLDDVLAAAAKGKTDADELVKLLEERKKDADAIKALETKVTDKDKEIKKQSDLAANTKTALDKAKEGVKDRDDKLAAADKEIKDLDKASKAKDATLDALVKDLKDADYLKKDAGREALPEGLAAAIKIAKMVDPKGDLRKMQEKLTTAEGQLKNRWSPQQMLAYWLPLMEQRSRKDLTDAALKDAERVLADGSATAADKARAQALQGLAQRNRDQFAEARATLEKAKAALAGDADFLAAAQRALLETTDPAGVAARQAQLLLDRGRADQALVELNRGLERTPNDARLLALRGMVHLEKASHTARDAQALEAARRDGEAAARAGAAEGHFLLGRVAEISGDWGEAVKAYRAAMEANKAGDAVAARYKASLARALVMSRAERAAFGDKRAKDALALDPAARRLTALALLAVLLQAPADAAQDEAQRLADEVLKSPDAPYDARAAAQMVKGLYTAALKTYVAGLGDTGQLSADKARDLLTLIEQHPFLKRVETVTVQDPLAAERHYFNGRSLYNARRYADAERSFRAAIEQFNSDARYFYYLGLSRMAQGDRDAYEFFLQGARLERQNKPAPDAVNKDLETIQGGTRRLISEARVDPR